MTRQTSIRRKALLAASSVVLALGAGCDLDQLVQNHPTDCGPDTDTDTQVVDTGRPSDEPLCNQGDFDAACCEARTEWCTDQHAFQTDDLVNECIFGPGFDGSTGCIPWGPPAPPRFGAILA